MFWKKSIKKDERSKILDSTSSDGRQSFRVTPSREAPLKATLNGTTITIINISSGGFCCENKNLKTGSIHAAEVLLPPEDTIISASVEILENTPENICRCRFLDLPQDVEDLLHLYVMKRQKEDQEDR